MFAQRDKVTGVRRGTTTHPGLVLHVVQRETTPTGSGDLPQDDSHTATVPEEDIGPEEGTDRIPVPLPSPGRPPGLREHHVTRARIPPRSVGTPVPSDGCTAPPP